MILAAGLELLVSGVVVFVANPATVSTAKSAYAVAAVESAATSSVTTGVAIATATIATATAVVVSREGG